MKNILTSLTLAMAAMLITSNALSQEMEPVQEPPLTIQWVIDEALRSNPDIQAAQNRWEAAQAAVSGARSLDDPMLNVHTWNVESPIRVKPDWNRSERRGVVSQKVPFPGKLRLRGKIASEDSEIAKKDWEEKIREILAQVKTAYYQLHYIYKTLDINKKNKDLLEKFSKIAETRYKVGKGAQRDVLAAQVELSRIIKDQAVLEEERKSAETRINTFLNRDPEAPLGKPEDYTMHSLAVNLRELEEMAIKNRPELQKFDSAIKKGRSTLNLAKKDYYFPDPEFMVMYMQTDNMADMWMSQLAFNVPWLWNKNRSRVKEAKESLQAAEADYNAVQNSVLFEVKDFWVKTINAQTTARIFSGSVVPLAEQSLKAALTEYETEKIDFLTLIDSERTLLTVELEYYRAVADFESNLAALERAVGVALVPGGP